MARSLVVKGATVIDGTGARPMAGMDVLIRDGRFEWIMPAGSGAEVSGATALDGHGKFLLPGLWESHTHLRPVLTDDPRASQAGLDTTLLDYASHGVTTVVDLGGPIDPFRAYRDRLPEARPAGRARVLFAGPSFTGVGGWPLPLHHNPALVNQIGAASQASDILGAQLDRRPDVVKIIYDGEPGSAEKLPREALVAIIAVAHRRDFRVLVHVHNAQDCLDALDAGADGIEHSFLPTPGLEEAEIEQVIQAHLRTGAYLTPTLTIWEQLGRAGDRDYLDELVSDGFMSASESEQFVQSHPEWGTAEFPHHPKAECRARLDAAFSMLRRMHGAGVKFATGSDIAFVLSRPMATLRELALLAQAGIPLNDVICAATHHAASKVGKAETVGTIQAGKIADAVLFNASPLTDLDVLVRPSHRVAVIRDGDVRSCTQAGASA